MSSTRVPLPIAEAPRPPRVVLSEPMRGYRCNQKGCCCRGWDIPFKLDDLIRLYEHLPEEERGELGAGLQLIVDEAPPEDKTDLILKSLKLAGVGEDRHCRFLEGSGGCTVHAKHGISALPDICVDFPAHGFRDEASGEVELYWDPVCPEVVRIFAEGDGQLALGAVERDATVASSASSAANAGGGPEENAARELPAEMGWHDPGFVQRVANAREPLIAQVAGVHLKRHELEHIRGESLRALEDRSRPTLDLLAALMHAYRELEAHRPLEFSVVPIADLEPFQSYFGGCIGSHGAPLLFWSLRKMERFVYAVDLKPLLAEPHALLKGLDGWGDALDRYYLPREESLRPIYARYLQHRFGMLYVNQEGEMREAADTICLIHGAGLRYSAAIAAALARPIDPAIAQAGIAAGEYLYRTLQFVPDAVPWFACADERAPAKEAVR